MSKIAPFPLKKVIAADVENGLFDEVMRQLETTADYLDREGYGYFRSVGTDGERVTYIAASGQLTTRLLAMASVMLAVRAWVRGDLTGAEARKRVDAMLLNDTPPKYAAPLPFRLQGLWSDACRLSSRVMGARQRLIAEISRDAVLEMAR